MGESALETRLRELAEKAGRNFRLLFARTDGDLVTAEKSNLVAAINEIALGGGVAGVTSFNTRDGAVSLLSADVTTALGFTPQVSDPQLTDFAGLAYAGNALKVVRVNAGATGLELATVSGGGGLSDGDYGDVTVSGAGTVISLDVGVAAANLGFAPTSVTGLTGVQSVAAFKTGLGLVKADVGLGNVDNIADAAKNVLSATKLTTARNINGVPFDGSANITINAVDSTARVPETRTISTTAPLTGGGDLSANRTLAITAATNLAPGSMSAADKAKLDAISGTNTGDQTITLTGNVTGSGTGSFATTIQPGVVTLGMQADMATASVVYRKTAGSGAPEVQSLATLKTDLGLTGTNSGDQTISLTGDVTGSGTGSFAATIGADKVTYAKIQNITATDRLLGRSTAGAGDVEEIVCTAAGRALLDDADASAQRTTLGLGTAALSASGDFQPIDADLTAIAALATTAYGRALLALADQAALTALIGLATTSLSGAMSAADKIKVNSELAAVKYDAVGSALGPAIADFFTSSISLEAASIYEITCHAYFLKTTAGTVTWTWTFSSAPTMATSRNQSTPVTGFTTATITGAEVFAEATAEAVAAMAHAASGSLTTAVRHSFMFTVLLRTNAATTIQLRATSSAGTVTPQPGSYMRARKIV